MVRIIAAATLLLQPLANAFAAAPQRDPPEKASDTADKVICKRFLETGSLVRGYRVCKTKADWERERAALRQSSNGAASCASMGQTGSCN